MENGRLNFLNVNAVYNPLTKIKLGLIFCKLYLQNAGFNRTS